MAKMHVESKVMKEMIIKTQIERYKHNTISGLVYNIRMKKYKERGEEIKRDLPVLESLYKRLGEWSLKNWLKEKIK